jgi:polysaccharide biosynthesis transport protein
MTSVSTAFNSIRRRKWSALAAFASVIGGAVLYLAISPPQYESSVRIMLNNDGNQSVSDLGRDLSNLPVAPGASPIATQVELARSERILQKALDRVAQKSPGSKLPSIDAFRNSLRISIVPATGILEMVYRCSEPKLCTQLVTSVATTIIEDNSATIRSQASSVVSFLAAELPKRQQALARAEELESRFRKANNVLSLDTQTSQLLSSLAELSSQERTITTQLKEAQVRSASLQKLLKVGPLESTYASLRIGQNATLQSLRNRLLELEGQVVTARSRLGDKNPELLSLIEQRDSVREMYRKQSIAILPKLGGIDNSNGGTQEAISQELTSSLINNEIELVTLKGKLTATQLERKRLEVGLLQLPNQQKVLARFQRERETASSSVSILQRKMEEARIAEAQLVSNISIIDQAVVPISPKWPSKTVVLILAGAAGCVLSAGLVLLLELLDNTLRNATEAELLLPTPVVGVLPALGPEAIQSCKAFFENIGHVESYRMLLKALEFRKQEKLKVIVISSTLSGEGKSLVAAHLAMVTSVLDRRTLLIDADLRKPTQHSRFNLETGLGLSDVVLGKCSFAESIKQTSFKNLDVMTCGEFTTVPSWIMESPRIHLLLAKARSEYDIVIIDTPPVTCCADAAVLSANSDGLLLIARPNVTPKDVLKKAVTELLGNKARLTGLVINGTTEETESYYRYPLEGYQSKRLLP